MPTLENCSQALAHHFKKDLPLPKDAFEFPLGINLWQSELRTRRRRIKEGYAFSLLENSVGSYCFTVMADAAKIAGIIRSFASCLPEEAFLILEYYQDEMETSPDKHPPSNVYYSSHLPTEEILDTIEPYFPRLIHDGFVGFGLANNRAGIELFYSEEKVLTCFTGNHIRVMDLLAQHGLNYKPNLLFPSDFGHDHLSLLCHPRKVLPEPLASMTETELDYFHFCGEIIDLLDMYPVEESLSFFLSKKEQDEIEERLIGHPDFAEFAEEDFGSLLLDWSDFVNDCETAFEGDLWEYRQGLKLRDMIQYVTEGVSMMLSCRIRDILVEADGKFKKNLVDRRKRLDPPGNVLVLEDRFWYRGMIRNQGAYLRRDLIRKGWYKP
jgi:hypothetical protein